MTRGNPFPMARLSGSAPRDARDVASPWLDVSTEKLISLRDDLRAAGNNTAKLCLPEINRELAKRGAA